MNINEYLDNLPDDIETIYLAGKNLTTLPDLTRFHSLQELYCLNNKLTSLPKLNITLKVLSCNYNKLTSLPPLPPNLKVLYCSANKLTSLPPLPDTLFMLHCIYNQLTNLPLLKNISILYCVDNPIHNIVSHHNFDVQKENVKKLYRLKELYYLLKFKKRFRDWLWIRVREPKIKEHYSVKNLLKLLENEDLEQVLDTW